MKMGSVLKLGTSFVVLASAAVAEPVLQDTYNAYGMNGMIDMPVAKPMADAEIGVTADYFGDTARTSLTFQVFPRLSGTFRYSMLDYSTTREPLYDRSFSLQYQLVEETERRPGVAVGVHDLLGTGVWASEYIVASKSLNPRLRVTGGIGWGRFGQNYGFTNPLGVFSKAFETRGNRSTGFGGEIEADQFFRGDAALFAGIEYQLSERIKLSAEISPDRYESARAGTFKYESPLNLGMTYKINDRFSVDGSYRYGREVGLRLVYNINPKTDGPAPSGMETGPTPVVPRERLSAASLGWTDTEDNRTRIGRSLRTAGVRLHAMRVNGSVARIEIENIDHLHYPEAIGRSARILSATMPAEVDTFEIVWISRGIRGTQVTLRRGDLEDLEFDYDNAWKSFARAEISSATERLKPLDERYPDFEYSIAPYLEPSFFDPDQPIRADIGLKFSAKYEPAPGFVLDAVVKGTLLGDVGGNVQVSPTTLPTVRTDAFRYERDGNPGIDQLTASYFFKPGENTYGRVTAGLLEGMYGGVSGEVLYKPIDTNWAVGVEANYVKKREYDKLFDFQNYEIATGHASLYYDLGQGYVAQVDAGRYLAGDWGTTFALDRTFKNGWSVGAFATFTDVSAADFGEGSFDKGIRFTVPLSFIGGQARRDKLDTTIRSLTRDGGQRVSVSNRLYDMLEDQDEKSLQDSWGRFWR